MSIAGVAVTLFMGCIAAVFIFGFWMLIED